MSGYYNRCDIFYLLAVFSFFVFCENPWSRIAQLGKLITASLCWYIFVKMFAERYKTESRDRGGEIALMLMVVMKMVSMVSSAFPLSNLHVTYWSLASCPCCCGAVLNHFPSDVAIARFADHFNHLLVIIMLYYRQQ